MFLRNFGIPISRHSFIHRLIKRYNDESVLTISEYLACSLSGGISSQQFNIADAGQPLEIIQPSVFTNDVQQEYPRQQFFTDLNWIDISP